MINLNPVTGDNCVPIISMEVHEHQKRFVATNAKSLSQAYARWKDCGTPPLTYGIYNNDDLVGFMMIDYETAEENQDTIKEPCYYLWRFMMDKNHQGKGYGKAALQQAIAHIRTKPMGEAAWFYTSVVPESNARKLYQDLGFVETGDIDDGELVSRLAI